MATDYEQFYKENPNGLGDPFKEFVTFFDTCTIENARVLDLGCGQGRDALFIARKGHRVVGVDISETGIKQMQKIATAEKLSIEGIVFDIRIYQPEGKFDIILIDRTLHMLGKEDRIKVLESLVNSLQPGGFVLIADERKNLPDMEQLLTERKLNLTLKTKGFLFMQLPA